MTGATVNPEVAERLREAADLLAQQGANPFRVSAYRRAADTLASLERDLRVLVAEGGVESLKALPGVGRGIAAAIAEMLITGHWGQLERLRGAVDPVALFQTIPGVGPTLARRIHDTLHIDSLPALEAAAWDGTLQRVPGMGARRAAALRGTLASLLGRVRGVRPARPETQPAVEALLEVDREYRDQAARQALPTITPRRFNPSGEAWLPIMHTRRGPWHFTALFSNTARAHELGRTRDWVVVYFYDDHHEEGQCTVVTETRGALTGRRVVRGREAECRAWYAQRP